MKIDFYLQVILDYIFIILISVFINLWVPFWGALGVSCGLFILSSIFLKKTPGMYLLNKSFKEKFKITKALKTLLFLGKQKITAHGRKMRRVFFAAGLAVFGLVAGIWATTVKEFSSEFEIHQKNAGWNYYISEERGFTVQLPKNPIVETKQLYVEQADKTLNYSEYKSVVGENTYYSVSFMDFPSRWRFVGSNKLLNAAFDILVKSEDAIKLVSKDSVQHKLYPAIEFVMMKGNEEWRGRLILVGNTFYKIMRVSSSMSKDDTEFDDFLRSFRFPNKNL